jgi:hypothetical protein
MECKETIIFGDDRGDNCCTFRCELERGHEGPHQESGTIPDGKKMVKYVLTWVR